MTPRSAQPTHTQVWRNYAMATYNFESRKEQALLTLCSTFVCWPLSRWTLINRVPSNLTRMRFPTISDGKQRSSRMASWTWVRVRLNRKQTKVTGVSIIFTYLWDLHRACSWIDMKIQYNNIKEQRHKEMCHNICNELNIFVMLNILSLHYSSDGSMHFYLTILPTDVWMDNRIHRMMGC